MTVADVHDSDYDPKKPANVPPLASNMALVNKADLRRAFFAGEWSAELRELVADG